MSINPWYKYAIHACGDKNRIFYLITISS